MMHPALLAQLEKLAALGNLTPPRIILARAAERRADPKPWWIEKEKDQ